MNKAADYSDYHFKVAPITSMVSLGKIGSTHIQLWLRAETPGTLKVEWWQKDQPSNKDETFIKIDPHNRTDNTLSFTIPKHGEFFPATLYAFKIHHVDQNIQLAQGQFETSPLEPKDYPEQFGIGLLSCNQPFSNDGAIIDHANDMLEASRKILHQHNAKMVFMVGDQMYSDVPKPLSLFNSKYFKTLSPNKHSILDCSAETIREIFQKRYRYFWNIPGWIRLNAEFPCYPILDDHEMIDNWGTNPLHQTPKWQSFKTGARAAYFDYQGSKVLPYGAVPPSFHYSIDYANTATFVMDIRSNRQNGFKSQLFDHHEQAAFLDFLDKNSKKNFLFVVLSVPIVHLPKKLVRLLSKLPAAPEDFSDRWSATGHTNDRDWFIKTVYQHHQKYPEQKIVLLSGDIHIGCFHQLVWSDNHAKFYQFISSGITHLPSKYIQEGSKILIKLNRHFHTLDHQLKGKVELIKGIKPYTQNPISGLNLGIIDIKVNGNHNAFRCSLYGHQGEAPVCRYQSDWIK